MKEEIISLIAEVLEIPEVSSPLGINVNDKIGM